MTIVTKLLRTFTILFRSGSYKFTAEIQVVEPSDVELFRSKSFAIPLGV